MKVSIIIPTFNRAKYVCEAIDSTLQQTMKDIEVIVVDDGSTDNTQEKIEIYKDKIHYIYTQNGGPAHARNIGMRAAQGEYISFLDSDDLYYPYKTDLQASFLDQYRDIAMVHTEFSAFDDNGFWDEYHLKKYHTAYKDGNLKYEDIYPEEITIKGAGLKYEGWAHKKIYMGNIFSKYFQNITVVTPTIMFRREVLKTVGMQNENYRILEEYDFALRISQHHKVAFIDLPTYKHRYHGGQISNTLKGKRTKINIEKQSNLLKIIENLVANEQDFLLHNKNMIENRFVILHKYLALPLMGKANQPKLARDHITKCAFYGQQEYFLYVLTFFPYFLRRVVMKALYILKLI